MEKTKERQAKLSIDETGEEMKEEDCIKWGLPLLEIYKLSLKFYKGKEFSFDLYFFVVTYPFQTNRVKQFI